MKPTRQQLRESHVEEWTAAAHDAGFTTYWYQPRQDVITFKRGDTVTADRVQIKLSADGKILDALLNGARFARPRSRSLRAYLYDQADLRRGRDIEPRPLNLEARP